MLLLQSVCIPDAELWLGSNLAGCDCLAVRVESHAENVIVVSHEVLLSVALGFHHDADACSMVDNFTAIKIS